MLQYILTHDLDRLEEDREDGGEGGMEGGEGGEGGLPRQLASMSSAGGKGTYTSEERDEEVRACDSGGGSG